MDSHIKRLLTSILLLPPLVWVVFWGGDFYLHILILLVSCIAVWEFISLFEGQKSETIIIKLIAVVFTFPVVLSDYLSLSPFSVIFILFWVLNLLFLVRYGMGKEIDWLNLQLIVLALFYIPLILHFIGTLTRWEIFYVVGLAFTSDTCAFYVGTKWGKHRLWPRISPKKSWEGAGGSILGAIIFSLLCGTLILSYPWYKALILGIGLNMGAQIGDLFESAVKRYLEVKDSSKILPGHGGILDRIDSLILVGVLYMAIGKL